MILILYSKLISETILTGLTFCAAISWLTLAGVAIGPLYTRAPVGAWVTLTLRAVWNKWIQ